jgi:hypothetical protein
MLTLGGKQMKRLLVLGLALFLVAAFTLPASALENKFGGYFEAVFDSYKSLNFRDEGTKDYSAARARSRLYYTAVLSDKLSFVNQFEMDTTFGQQASAGTKDSYGSMGADGIAVEVKQTYLDFTLDKFRFEVGTQGFQLHRGLAMNDEASGIKASYRGGNIIPAIWWWRLYDGDKGRAASTDTGATAAVPANAGADVDQYTALVNIKVGDMQFVPVISYLTANSGVRYAPKSTAGQPMNVYFAGVDFNMKADKLDLAFTGIYEGGSLNDATDISAYALYGKVGFKLGNFGLRAAALYTTGEEATATGDYDGFWYPEQSGSGASFSTSELFRKGADWTKTTDFGNGNSPENRMEFGLGFDVMAAKDVKIAFDFWNLNLAEDAASGNSDVGNEIDLVGTIGLMKGLNLDLIGAYLIVGDAYKPAVDGSDYAWETSARLRLSF